MSRSWGRAHHRRLQREPPARPLPGAALSRVTAVEVVERSRLEGEIHGPTDPETRRRGARRTALHPGPQTPRPRRLRALSPAGR